MATNKTKATARKRVAGAGTRAAKRPAKAAASGGRTRKTRNGSDILASVHETMSDLHEVGVIDAQTMRKFDKMCLAPVLPLRPTEIAALRKRERVSQPVFAAYLNVSKSSVSQWETGEKKPDGPALKLLNLVSRKGLQALA